MKINKTTVFLILLVLFIAYYSSKATAALDFTYRIGRVANFGFAPFPTAIRFVVEIIVRNPSDVTVNLQNADMSIFLSNSYIGSGVMATQTNLLQFSNYEIDESLNDETNGTQELQFSRNYEPDESLTRIQPNAETGFLINCSVQTTDLLLAVGGVYEDLKNRKINVTLKGNVKAELIVIPVEAQILLQIPKFKF